MRHQKQVVKVVKETGRVAFGELNNGERVFITSDAKEAALREDDAGETLEGKYLRGAIGPNKDEERRETTPWIFFFFNQMASEEEFHASTPPSIKNEEESDGSEIVDIDKLDDVVEDLATAIEPSISCIEPKELKKQISNQLIDEDVDPTTTNFTKMVAARLKQTKEEQHGRAREVVSQILSKGAIPGLIRQEAKRLIELGEESYWNNGKHPKTIMTDIVGSDPVSEPEPEPAVAEPEAAVA